MHSRPCLQGDVTKLRFTTEAFGMSDPTLACKVVPDAVDAAIGWAASSTDAQVTAYREAVITEIEQLGNELRKSGACDRCVLALELVALALLAPLCSGGYRNVTLTQGWLPVM